jgi:hypothetical protein
MNLIKANIRPEFMIKESDQNLHHFLMTRILVNPADPTHPERRQRVLCVRNVDYRKYFDCDTAMQIRFLKAMNYESAELIHDPALGKVKEEEPIPGPVTVERLSGNNTEAPVKAPVKRNTRKR